jgi:hypothetical protein
LNIKILVGIVAEQQKNKESVSRLFTVIVEEEETRAYNEDNNLVHMEGHVKSISYI